MLMWWCSTHEWRTETPRICRLFILETLEFPFDQTSFLYVIILPLYVTHLLHVTFRLRRYTLD